jgi:hypothetical protein
LSYSCTVRFNIMTFIQVISAFFALMPIHSLFVGSKHFYKKLRLIKTGVKAIATIIDFDEKKDSDKTEYFPIVRFKTFYGNIIEAKTTEPRYSKPYIEKQISIYYDPVDPTEFTIVNKWLILRDVIMMLVLLYLAFIFIYLMITGEEPF